MNSLNEWVGYLTRSKEQIEASVKARLRTYTPEMTDLSKGNPLMVVVDFFSGIAEMLGVYIDDKAREQFLETARKYANVVYNAKVIGYNPSTANSAYVDIYIYFTDSDGNPQATTSYMEIPQGAIFDIGGYPFYSTEKTNIPLGSTSVKVLVAQGQLVTLNLGTTTSEPYQKYTVGSKVAQGSSTLLLLGQVWQEVRSLSRTKPTDKVYSLGLNELGLAEIAFGDNLFGMIPPSSQSLDLIYIYTEGSIANTISEISVPKPEITYVFPGVEQVTYKLEDSPSGGTDYETIEEIRHRAPLSLRTLDRAWSYQDLKDVALLAPGVFKSEIHYCCGACADIYIIGAAPGFASEALLKSAHDFICERLGISTCINLKSAGISEIILSIEINPKMRQPPSTALAVVQSALLEAYSLENRNINQPIRLSDIYALVDNLPIIEYANILKLTIRPYPMPQNSNRRLISETLTKETSNTTYVYTIRYNGSSQFSVFRDNVFRTNMYINGTYEDDTLYLKVLPGVYTMGDTWKITTYLPNQDIPLGDYTVGVLTELDIQVNPTLTQLSCKGGCR